MLKLIQNRKVVFSMKYLKYVGLLLIMLFPLNVNALISFSCKGPANPNKEVSCNISSDGKIKLFEATLVHDSKVTYFGVLPGTGFTSESSHTDLKFTSTGGGTTVAAVKFFVPSTITSNTSFTVNLTNIKYIFNTDDEERTQSNLNEIVSIIIPTSPTTTTTKKVTTTAVAPGSQKTFTVTLDLIKKILLVVIQPEVIVMLI